MTGVTTLAWATLTDAQVSVHAPVGTDAERAAPRLLAEATGALAELAELLGPSDEQREQPVDIYVVDDPAQLSASDGAGARAVLEAATRGDAIVVASSADQPSAPVTVQLTQMLVARWFGPAAASVEPVVGGLIGLVAAGTGEGPDVREADEFVRASSPAASPEASATSFVAFLIRTYGPGPLRQYLAEYDPTRSDRAAVAAFNEPLASLQEAWLASLQGSTSTREAARKLARQLAPRMRQNWLRELEVTAYTLLDTGLAVAFPLLTGQLVNEMVSGDADALLPYTVLLVGIFLLTTPIAMRRSYASAVLSQDIVLDLQRDVFRRLLRLPHSFHAQANVGDLMARLGTDTERVRSALETVLRSAVFTVIKGIVAAVVLFFIQPVLALLALAAVPLFWIGYLLLRSRLESTSSQAQTLFGEVATTANEGLSAHAVVKAFGLESHTEAEYQSRLRAFFGAVRRLVTLGSALDASTGAAMTVSQLGVLVAGGYMVSQGDLEVGFLFTFMATVPMLFEGSIALAGIGKTIEEASGSMDRVLEILEAPLEVDERPDAVTLSPLASELRFENVSFGYGDEPVLHDFDLIVQAGAHVAIVGRSGCGKTTAINLLLRFWDPSEGRVLVDGHDLRDVTIASLRQQIGIVFQDTFVFDTTVRENIALARPGASDAEVEAAARAAQLETYVAGLANGFDTVLGERGVRMSGGQRQRLAIARALLRDPAILILDEATSALDPETESEIQAALAAASAGRTTITITHRLRTAADADRIVVLERGRIEAQGTHDELMAARGLYRDMYDEQAGNADEQLAVGGVAGAVSE